MKEIFQTNQFKKNLKRIKKRGKDISKLKEVISIQAKSEALDQHHRDHALSGNWLGSRDYHIETNWLLIYREDGDSLFLERIGSHSDLFK